MEMVMRYSDLNSTLAIHLLLIWGVSKVDYTIKQMDEVFYLDKLQEKIDNEGDTYPVENQWDEKKRKPLEILVGSSYGHYQVQQLLEIFTDLEVDDEEFKENLGEYTDEWLFYIQPEVEERLGTALKIDEGDFISISTTEGNDIILDLIIVE